MPRILNIQQSKQEDSVMHTYAWTFNVKSEMRETGEVKANGRPRYKQAYTINEVFPRLLSGVEIVKNWSGDKPGEGKLTRDIVGPASEEEAINGVWQFAKGEVERLLSNGKNLMAIVVCIEKGEKGVSICSAYEEKFNLGRGIQMAEGRLRKLLKVAGKNGTSD